ncbi:MAG: sigma-70 family RNA polymerase sigma factor [Clostridia bacterium]|nr:sigma-70 family RNA polymerase sigma factor [Clostridia bacterium]
MELSREIFEYMVDGKLDLDRVVDEFSPYVRTVIGNMSMGLLKQEDIEEILVDTFFVLWKSVESGKRIYPLDGFIAGITRNLVKEKLRKFRAIENIEDYENLISIYEDETYFEERQEIAVLTEKMKELKEVDITILNLFYFERKAIKDIAKEVGLTEANVKQRLHRIRKKIRKEISKGA